MEGQPNALALARRFAACLAAGRALTPGVTIEPDALALADLGDGLAAAHSEGSSRWPGVELDALLYAAHLAKHVGVEGYGLPGTAAISSLHAAELYLACACGEGYAHALTFFEAEYLSHVGEYVARIQRAADAVSEIRQVLRVKLLVTQGAEKPGITEYSGRGSLGAWVRVAAVRTALDFVRRSRDAREDVDGARDVAAPGLDPELDVVRAVYKDGFAEAFRGAALALEPKQRNVLKLHYLDGLTLDETAVACRTSRATAARWLAAAREALLDETRRRLFEKLQLSEGDLGSVVRYAQSHFDMSIRRYFGG